MFNLVIKGGTVVTGAGLMLADIGIEGEHIAAIGTHLHGREEINAQGLYVLPGLIDVHVHLQMPAGDIVTTDDFFTGTMAAACGGTTTVIDFIEQPPDGSPGSATGARRAEADGRVAVDYSLHLTGNSSAPAFLEEIAALAQEGYTSLKLYTTYDLMVDDRDILRLLETCKSHGLLPIVHAENDAIIAHEQSRLLAAGLTTPRYHPQSRPCTAEAEAVQRVLALAAIANAPVYFVHMSCAESLEAVERARAAGQTVYVEVTPQHLLLDETAYHQPDFEGAKYCCAPPLRNRRHLDALWHGLQWGKVQTVATDHCPWDFATHRQRGQENFTLIPNGLPGIETRPMLLYHFGVNAGRISLPRFVELCATTPAALFGLAPRKGSIAVGADADLVLWDPKREITLSVNSLHQHVDYCPYEGWKVLGAPRTVFLRGTAIVRDGQFAGAPGMGQFIPRAPFTPDPGKADR